MEQHVPHPPLVPHAPHAPRPPTGPSQPRRRKHHRVVRPSQPVEVPKIDLSFKSPESDEDSDPTDFDKPQVHTSDMHADAYNAALLNTNQMGAFHADRSRTFGMTYLEKAYGRSGFHLPDIKVRLIKHTHTHTRARARARAHNKNKRSTTWRILITACPSSQRSL